MAKIDGNIESLRDECLGRIDDAVRALGTIKRRLEERKYFTLSPFGELGSRVGTLDCRLSILTYLDSTRSHEKKEAASGE